jgi:5-methylcytosine-specific restriction protein A
LVKAPHTACPAHQRGSSHARGYDGAWRALRSRHLASHPLCVVCGKDVGMGGHVDHVKAHQGIEALRLDPGNLQTMCASCHSMKTCSSDGGFGH